MTSYSGFSDTELVVFLKEGNRPAFTELYNRYKEPLYFHANRMLGNHDDARDVVHDLFAAIWTKKDGLVIPSAVNSYLYGSIRNRILDFIAHQKVAMKYIDSIDSYLEQGADNADEKLREKELIKMIETEIARLPEKMREVFELSRKEELSHKEIAEKLNISDKTVKKQIGKAIKILKYKIKLGIFFSFFC